MDLQIPRPLYQALASIGILYVTAKLFSALQFIASTFLLPGIPLSKFGPKGSYALITGASDGIGREFALQIAKRGYNVILVSRTASKLDALKSEIQSQNASIDVKTLAMDFAANSDNDYSSLQKLIDGLDISILINNVGLSHSIPQTFVDTPEQSIEDIITVNDIGTLRVTKLVTPGMISRRRGLILTMASFGGVVPTPLLATYSGSKAFLQHWGTALGAELAPHGILVQVVQSHLVTSNMSKIRQTSLLVPSAKNFVKSTLAKIGRAGGSQGVPFTITPWWSHGSLLFAITSTIGVWNTWLLGHNKGIHEDIRRRALRKAEREAKKGE